MIGSLVQFRSTIQFSTEKLLALQGPHDLPNTIRYGYSRSDNKPHVHFVCTGAPMHSSPANQELAGHIYARLRYYTRLYRFITTVLQKLNYKKADSYTDKHDSKIITPSNVSDNVTINEVNYINIKSEMERNKEMIEEQIISTLTLDLPQQKKDGFVTLVDSNQAPTQLHLAVVLAASY